METKYALLEEDVPGTIFGLDHFIRLFFFFAQYPAHYGACNSSIDRWTCVQKPGIIYTIHPERSYTCAQ